MEPTSVEFRTEAQSDRDSMLSPEFEYDVSIIGVFIGAVLGVALLLNNVRRGAVVMTTVKSAFTTIVTAAHSLKGAQPASYVAAVVAAKQPEPPHVATTSHTSSEAVTYVFSERA